MNPSPERPPFNIQNAPRPDRLYRCSRFACVGSGGLSANLNADSALSMSTQRCVGGPESLVRDAERVTRKAANKSTLETQSRHSGIPSRWWVASYGWWPTARSEVLAGKGSDEGA